VALRAQALVRLGQHELASCVQPVGVQHDFVALPDSLHCLLRFREPAAWRQAAASALPALHPGARQTVSPWNYSAAHPAARQNVQQDL
jgi:hypothetical protein